MVWAQTSGYQTLDFLVESQFSINDLGQIAGNRTYIDSEDAMEQRTEAVFWDQENGIRLLGTLGGQDSQATAINNISQVVGSSVTEEGNYHAFLWDEENGMVDLGTLGGTSSHSYCINNSSQVVGSSKASNEEEHAFIWDPANGMRDLGTLGGSFLQSLIINDSGQVAGISHSIDDKWYPFFWSETTGFENLSILFPDSDLYSVMLEEFSDTGFLVGTYLIYLEQIPRFKSFFWSPDSGMHIFPTDILISGVNNLGQVVGVSENRPFVWSSETGMNIYNYSYNAFEDINNNGDIVGSYTKIEGWWGPFYMYSITNKYIYFLENFVENNSYTNN